nr:uncharacterized protein CI109_001694 [Kwoniella shandongensis]KAA5529755.1 hypothetical protein CI109_001694 [Kwoniella shandongensis]
MASAALVNAKPIDVTVLAGAPINSLNLTLTPSEVVQCTNLTLSWGSGDAGTAPYRLAIGSGGYYTNLTWLYEYNNIAGTELGWVVNATAGDSLLFQLWDSSNTTTYTQNHIVQAGEESCLSASNSTTPPNNGSSTTTSNDSNISTLTSEGGETNKTIGFVSVILSALKKDGEESH